MAHGNIKGFISVLARDKGENHSQVNTSALFHTREGNLSNWYDSALKMAMCLWCCNLEYIITAIECFKT